MAQYGHKLCFLEDYDFHLVYNISLIHVPLLPFYYNFHFLLLSPSIYLPSKNAHISDIIHVQTHAHIVLGSCTFAD